MSVAAMPMFVTTADTSKAREIPDSLRRYPFKSAIIQLEYGGSCSGIQLVYIDDYGMKEAKVDSFMTEMMGMQQPTYKMEITDWDSMFSADMMRGMASKGLNPFSAKDRKLLAEVGGQMAKGMGIEEGKDTLLGKPCAVWSMESMSSKVWLWYDITLKSSVAMDDFKQLLEVKHIDLEVSVPVAAFQIPAGLKTITPEDINKMLEKMDQQEEKPPAKKPSTKKGKKKK